MISNSTNPNNLQVYEAKRLHQFIISHKQSYITNTKFLKYGANMLQIYKYMHIFCIYIIKVYTYIKCMFIRYMYNFKKLFIKLILKLLVLKSKKQKLLNEYCNLVRVISMKHN